MVFQGADVAHEGGVVRRRRRALSQDVVPVSVRHVVALELVPLLEEVVVTVVTSLDAAGSVHRLRAGRPRVTEKARVERLLSVHLLRQGMGQGTTFEFVTANVTDLKYKSTRYFID